MFYDPQRLPWTSNLRQNWRTIQEEMHSLDRGRFVPWALDKLYQGKWQQFVLFAPGYEFKENQALAPKTTSLVREIPGVTLATFARLTSGTHVHPHIGYTHVVLRAHLGLKVPDGECWLRVGEETRKWQEGEFLVFDDMVEHEVTNQSNTDRIVLMLDFLRPFKLRTSFLGHFRQRLVLKRQLPLPWKQLEDFHQREIL